MSFTSTDKTLGVALSHKHGISDVKASGTPSSSTYLRGDGSWATPAGSGNVDSVNGQTGTVVLDADDIDDSATTHKFVTASDLTTLSNTSGTNTGDQDISGKLDANTPITGATKTKITYDADGLVTAGADATTADISDSTDRRYVTDAQLTVIGNTSGTNTGDQTLPTRASLGLDTTDTVTFANLSGTNTGDQDLTSYQLKPSEGAFVNGDKTKLDGIATNATANSSDATLLSRANHTGTQTASTISDFDTEVSNNADVAANTSARHAAVTLGTNTATALSLAGQELSIGDVFVQNAGDTMTGTLDVTATNSSSSALIARARSGQTVSPVRVLDSSSNTLFDVDANGMASAPYWRGGIQAGFQDDTAFNVTIPTGVNGGMLLFYLAQSGTLNGILTWRTGSSPYCTILVAQSGIETSTSVLTGTTGTDGKITISATGGKIYFENRSGSSQTVRYFLLI